MSRTETFGQERKYSVATLEGVTRIYTSPFKYSPSLGLTPDRGGSNVSNRPLRPPMAVSENRSRSDVNQPRAYGSQIPPATTTTCFGISRKRKAPNPKDAYVYMDCFENRAIILDNGKPFIIPVNIRGKYSIINTTSRLSITVLKEKFGMREPSKTPKCEETMTIERKSCNRSTCGECTGKECCSNQSHALNSGKTCNQKGNKIPNSQCTSKYPCYCKRCKQ